MPTVKFSINLREDAMNWVRVGKTAKPQYGRTLADFTSEIPKDILRGIRRRSRRRAITYVHRYLKTRQPLFQTDLVAMKALLEEYFKKRGSVLLDEVAKLTAKQLYRQRFFATFTLLGTCPYYYERAWFMIPAKRHMVVQLKTIAHEILHLQFIHYYHQYCRDQGLTEKQFQDLKEAMTVLLNEPQFRKFHLALDVGYTDHARLRKCITRQWQKRQPYTKFLDACIAATKRIMLIK